VLGRGSQIEVSDLPPALTEARPEVHERLFADLPSLDELQRRYVLHVLDSVGGNRTRAAEVLGVDRRTQFFSPTLSSKTRLLSKSRRSKDFRLSTTPKW
jgi:transcriptional regulator of acetoin/glycerol metabolism